MRKKLRQVWYDMNDRCCNEKNDRYHRYGGRGIQVCDRWKDFDSFYQDLSPSYFPGWSLDRIDNDGDYTPENCQWLTVAENSRKDNTAKQRIEAGTHNFLFYSDEFLKECGSKGGKTSVQRGRHKGENNSQHGTMWITTGIESKKIKRDDLIPDGWRRGRVINAAVYPQATNLLKG